MERAYHVPQLDSPRTRPRRFRDRTLSTIELSAADVGSLLAALRAGAPRTRTALRRRARALGRAARRFLDVTDPLYRRAADAIPALTGFSREVVEEGLRRTFEPLAEADLARVAESGDGVPVSLVGIVSAGNIPGVALPKMALALAAGSSCLVKTASGEPLLAALFAEAISSIDPALGSAVAVLWWDGSAEFSPPGIVSEVDSLVAYGSDGAIASLQALAPRAFLGHGHKLSVAVVRLDVARAQIERMAAAAAIDVALYDQLGCLSPQCVYVTAGDREARRMFVSSLGGELEQLSERLPRGEVSESASLAIRRLRDEFEWQHSQGGGRSSVDGRGWTILVDPASRFESSPLHRTIFVRPLENVAALSGALGPWLERVESVGIGPWPDPQAEAALRALGIPRIAPLGRMQSPDLDWRQGGTHPLAGIIGEPATAETAAWP